VPGLGPEIGVTEPGLPQNPALFAGTPTFSGIAVIRHMRFNQPAEEIAHFQISERRS
jgi:hypothetical protein